MKFLSILGKQKMKVKRQMQSEEVWSGFYHRQLIWPQMTERTLKERNPQLLLNFSVCYFYLFARFSVIKIVKLKESNKKVDHWIKFIWRAQRYLDRLSDLKVVFIKRRRCTLDQTSAWKPPDIDVDSGNQKSSFTDDCPESALPIEQYLEAPQGSLTI